MSTGAPKLHKRYKLYRPPTVAVECPPCASQRAMYGAKAPSAANLRKKAALDRSTTLVRVCMTNVGMQRDGRCDAATGTRP